MAVTVTHATEATAPNDPAKEVSSDAWNAGHTVAGLGDAAELDVGTDAGTVAAGDHNHDAAYEAKNANIQAHVASTSNPHSVTKAQVGLANVDNTSDAAKPVSTATQTALDGKAASSHGTHIPAGGTTGQVLAKATNDDGDVEWADAGEGSGDGLGPDGDKGDVTVGGTGTTLTIDNAAVTLAKMANLAQSTVVGRAAGAGTGVPTALSVAQLIAVLGSAATPISQVAIQAVAASGDYTPTAGMKYCICLLTGSGGGGGGADSSTTTNDIGVGGGGGAGSTRIGYFTAAQIGASKAVVLNAGGTAGSATNGTNGGTPSDNTFGTTLLVAPGGLGGVGSGVAAEALNANLGGAGGGAGSGGVFGAEGGGGGAAYGRTVDGTVGDGSMGFGGMGGSSFWGGGGLGGALFSTTIGVSAVSAGTDGKAYGSGGGGAVSSDTAAGAAGGAGKIGIFVAIEFI